ncbi:hypothetical protein TRIATDRAFT_85097 [Trichoderma atroviride IMI 206040]|uniref:Uncharacterized protein n=1 Tax=Hypocrea atroviridis (strain ATCC 20476 / IMI 206040) TaxID=452589 RepID=G9P942_HYPAI|nr:uncharacterized protein TRIATDRAFT_85097 [Trichoderma atroviride IMI 206040]EHK41070.1 hypothetical protein TRIATDRAFT_85097 [Trichoderma atroviride IMI 206040]
MLNINSDYHAAEVSRFVAREGMSLQIAFTHFSDTGIGSEVMAGEIMFNELSSKFQNIHWRRCEYLLSIQGLALLKAYYGKTLSLSGTHYWRHTQESNCINGYY